MPGLCPLNCLVDTDYSIQHVSPQLYSSQVFSSFGIVAWNWQSPCLMMPGVWCFTGTPSTQEMLSAFFPPWCFAVENQKLQLNPETIPKHSWLIPTAAWLWVPTSNMDMPHFQMDWSIKMWTTKAVYGRTETHELHNSQLPCPLTPHSSPFNLWFIRRWVQLCVA